MKKTAAVLTIVMLTGCANPAVREVKRMEPEQRSYSEQALLDAHKSKVKTAWLVTGITLGALAIAGAIVAAGGADSADTDCYDTWDSSGNRETVCIRGPY